MVQDSAPDAHQRRRATLFHQETAAPRRRAAQHGSGKACIATKYLTTADLPPRTLTAIDCEGMLCKRALHISYSGACVSVYNSV